MASFGMAAGQRLRHPYTQVHFNVREAQLAHPQNRCKMVGHPLPPCSLGCEQHVCVLSTESRAQLGGGGGTK